MNDNKPLHLKQNQDILVQQAVHQIWSGPLPPPEILKNFNDVLPTAAERIFIVFESETIQRHKIETRGQFFGFIVSLLVIGGAIWLLTKGQTIGGLTSLVGAVGTFIWLQERRPKRPRADKGQAGPP